MSRDSGCLSRFSKGASLASIVNVAIVPPTTTTHLTTSSAAYRLKAQQAKEAEKLVYKDQGYQKEAESTANKKLK